jgi:hypothetical protein
MYDARLAGEAGCATSKIFNRLPCQRDGRYGRPASQRGEQGGLIYNLKSHQTSDF